MENRQTITRRSQRYTRDDQHRPRCSPSPTVHSRRRNDFNSRSPYSGDESESSSAHEYDDEPHPGYVGGRPWNSPQHRTYTTYHTSAQRYQPIEAEDTPYVPRARVEEPPPRPNGRYLGRMEDWQGQMGPGSRTTHARDYDRRGATRETSVSPYESGTSQRRYYSDSPEEDSHGSPPSRGSSHLRDDSVSVADSDRGHRFATSGSARQYEYVNDEPYTASTRYSSVPYNQERYPAFEQERRIGLDHIRYDHGEQQANSHYRPRTHRYPAPEEDVPHVMSVSLESSKSPDATAPSTSPSTQFPFSNSNEPDPGSSSRHTPTPNTRRGRHAPAIIPAEEVENDAKAAVDHLRKSLGLGPDQAASLDTLPDPPPGDKPNFPYPVLIQLAILGSPRKRLTLQEIYNAIEDRFEWFKNNQDKAWQGSIRHTLSLKACFKSIAKPITEPGKGSYWIVDFNEGDGNKRVRKRNPRPKSGRGRGGAQVARREEEEESSNASDHNARSNRCAVQAPIATRADDSNIDPNLRNEGHVVGEGRITSAGPVSRSNVRRGHSPYSAAPSSSQPTGRPRVRPLTSSQMATSSAAPPERISFPAPSITQQPHATFGQTSFGGGGQRFIAQTGIRELPGSRKRNAAAKAAGNREPTATFGQPSFPASLTGTVAAPSNWTPYGATVVQTSATAPSQESSLPSSLNQSTAPASRQTVDNGDDSFRQSAIRLPIPRSGVQVVRDGEGLLTARRVPAGTGRLMATANWGNDDSSSSDSG